MADKNPNRIIGKLAPKTLRERWNNYWNRDADDFADPNQIDALNQELVEIENRLPFENQAEHDKWTNILSDYRGNPEFDVLMDKILKRHEKHSLDPEQTAQLKKYRGKDYDEAMKRYLGGEGVGDILSGLITHENYDDVDVFDEDYQRSYGPGDAVKRIHKLLRENPTLREKDIRKKYPSASDDIIKDAFSSVETVNSFAGVPLSSPEYYYRGIRYAPTKEEEEKLKDQIFQKVHSKLPF